MREDNYRKIGELLRYIGSDGCCAAGVESRWHQVFNIVLRDLGFTRKQRSLMWDELVAGNWERLHLTDEEKAKPPSEFLDDFYYDVLYCSDRWSLDRLTRCHWLFRAYKRRAEERDGCCECGSYLCQVPSFAKGGEMVWVDKCIAEEVADLNGLGVETVGSCCGHGGQGSILVAAGDAARMDELGYRRLPRDDSDGLAEFESKSETRWDS